MIFEPDTWDSPQILVITATNDDINMNSPYFASFGMALFSLDENFHSAAVPEVNLSIEDNDQGITEHSLTFYVYRHTHILTYACIYPRTHTHTYVRYTHKN